MRKRETIRGYKNAEENISQLEVKRVKRGLTRHDLSQQTGVRMDSLKAYESGEQLPTVKNYNKLCEVLGLSPIEETTPRSKEHYQRNQRKRCFPNPPEECEKSLKLPGIVCFKFEEGQKYTILTSSSGVQGIKDAVKDCVFIYERKQGIHHMFREARGGWTRTYTDAQLVGKKIHEVHEE